MPRAVRDQLRTTTLRDARDGREVRVPWQPHGINVLLFVHPDCEACGAYLDEVDALDPRLRNWGGRVRLVTTDGDRGRRLAQRLDLDVLIDPQGALHGTAAVEPGAAALLIIDTNGEVFHSLDLGSHAFPSGEQLLDEVRFPALLCPGCETIDHGAPA